MVPAMASPLRLALLLRMISMWSTISAGMRSTQNERSSPAPGTFLPLTSTWV